MMNEEEKAFFLEQIEKCKEEINSTCCHFTDGSLLPGGNAGCGVTVEGSDIEFKVMLHQRRVKSLLFFLQSKTFTPPNKMVSLLVIVRVP